MSPNGPLCHRQGSRLTKPTEIGNCFRNFKTNHQHQHQHRRKRRRRRKLPLRERQSVSWSNSSIPRIVLLVLPKSQHRSASSTPSPPQTFTLFWKKATTTMRFWSELLATATATVLVLANRKTVSAALRLRAWSWSRSPLPWFRRNPPGRPFQRFPSGTLS